MVEGLEERRAETGKNSAVLENALKEIDSVKSLVEDDLGAKVGSVESGLSKVVEGLEGAVRKPVKTVQCWRTH